MSYISTRGNLDIITVNLHFYSWLLTPYCEQLANIHFRGDVTNKYPVLIFLVLYMAIVGNYVTQISRSGDINMWSRSAENQFP
jgi:hypothetical protein